MPKRAATGTPRTMGAGRGGRGGGKGHEGAARSPSLDFYFACPAAEGGGSRSKRARILGASAAPGQAAAGASRDEPIVVADGQARIHSDEGGLAGHEVVVIEEDSRDADCAGPGCGGAAVGRPGCGRATDKSGGSLSRKKETSGNFGALIDPVLQSAHAGGLLRPSSWGGSYSIAYRNTFQDRRPAGVGIHGESWGKRVQLQLGGFRASVFGGGKAADMLTIPTAGPYKRPRVDARHWGNLCLMIRALGVLQAPPEKHALFDHAHRQIFQKLLDLPTAGQHLFSTLHHAAHPACGGQPASSCRWFMCHDAVPEAKALCDAGLARRLQSVRDIEGNATCLLPLLTGHQLREVLKRGLGGSAPKSSSRDGLVAAVLLAAGASQAGGQQCIRFQRGPGASAAPEGGSSPPKPTGSPSNKSVQAVLSGGVRASLPRALLEILAAGTPRLAEGPGRSHTVTSVTSGAGRRGSRQAPKELMDGVWCIRLAEDAEAACQRLQRLFFASAGFSPDDAAALLLCDMERLAGGLGWTKSPNPSGLVGCNAGDDEYDVPAGAGAEEGDRGERPHAEAVAGGKEGAAGVRPVAEVLLPTRLEAQDFLEAVACSDALEAAVRCGDSRAAYKLLAEAAAAVARGKEPEAAAESGSCEGESDCAGGGRAVERGRVRLPCFWSRVVVCGIGLLERDKRYRAAVHYIDLLLDKSVLRARPGARGQLLLRKVMDLQHAGAHEGALRVCELACRDMLVRGEYRLALEARCARLCVPPYRWKKPVLPARLSAPARTIDGDHGSVEMSALDWYIRQGGWSHGAHTENGVWLTLFGILMADILVAGPAARALPLMEAPVDLREPSFFAARRWRFLTRLRSMGLVETGGGVDLREAAANEADGHGRCEDEGEGADSQSVGRGVGGAGGMPVAEREGDVVKMLEINWRRFWGRMCLGVDWQRFTLADLSVIVRCLGGQVTAHVCHLLAQDYGLWGHGLPDLLVWHPGQQKALLVEVKGPGDSLSHAQACWIHELLEAGASVEVCHVRRNK